MKTVNRLPSMNGTSATPLPAAPPVASGAPLFSGAAIAMHHRMRINPLPRLNPQSLGTMLDQFEYGYLREPVLLWEQMVKRDDTLVTVKPQLENEVSSKQWGVFTVEGADEKEAARHKACLEYFYDHLTVTDAYDRNVRGGRDKLIELMMGADSFFYAAFHFVWKPQPGKTVPVAMRDAGSGSRDGSQQSRTSDPASRIPVITAELEHVPLWFFENTTGTLRFLKDGGFGTDGSPLSEFGDWIVATGRGLMFAASICYTFKRLAFQDWVVFNERYAQNKVIGVTPGAKESPQGIAMESVVGSFNEDQGIVFYEFTGDADKPPVSLLGPSGTASVEIWDKFIERQDRKMSSMYRGNDLSMMSRAGKGEKPTGASLQADEGDEMIRGACRRIAGALQESCDRRVIELCFGPGVEPLAYFGLPDMDAIDTDDLRKSAGFLADRGAHVNTSEIADRLGIELDDSTTVDPAARPTEILQPLKTPANSGDTRQANRQMTANALQSDLENFLGDLVPRFKKAWPDGLIPLRLALEHVLKAAPGNYTANARALQAQLPWLADQILDHPPTAPVLVEIIEKAMERGITEAEGTRS